MANNIIFRTNLLRGAQGPQGDTGTAEAIPSDGVIWYDGAEAPAGFVETTAPSGISDIQTAVDVVSARVDEIEALPDGSTTADAELVDIRVGADGTSYATAGDAVREQVEALDEKIDDTNETQDYTISANSIVGTAEGNPITISDGGNCNVRELVATLSPTQAGSGDPSPTNVRAISGVSTLEINRAGKNLLNGADVTIEADSGNHNIDVGSVILKAGTYTYSAYQDVTMTSNTRNTLAVSYGGNVYYENANQNAHLGSGLHTITFTLATEQTVAFRIWGNTLSNTTTYSQLQVEQGSSATTYEPYQGTTLSLSLGDTVYGGSVDLTSGVLTIDRVGVVFDGSEDWALYGSGSASAYAMKVSVSPIPEREYGVVSVMSNYLQCLPPDATWGDYPSFVATSMSVAGFVAGINTITTVADWKTYLASNNLQVVYKLATPTQTQLTPQSLRLIQGNNTLWANGELEVEYVKDATIIINDILSRLEALEG